MGSHSYHTQVVHSSAMLLSCRVGLCLPGVGALHPCKETERDTERNLSNDNRMSHRNRPVRHQESGGKSYGTDTANYGRKAPTQWTSRSCITPEIAEQLLQNALSPSTRRRKLLTWSYGENDSIPWTPVCT